MECLDRGAFPLKRLEMKLTTAELVVYLIQNGYAKSQTAALKLLGYEEGEFSAIRNKAN